MKIIPSLYVLSIFLLIYLADNNQFPAWLSAYREIPYGDKVGHFVLLGIFTLSLNALLNFKRIPVFSFNLFCGTAITIVFITIEESSQIMFANRTFSLLDLFANYLGIIFFGDSISRFITNCINKSSELN